MTCLMTAASVVAAPEHCNPCRTSRTLLAQTAMEMKQLEKQQVPFLEPTHLAAL